MTPATKLIQQIQNNQIDDILLDIYVDETLISYQKERYIRAIEKYISLYGDEEVDIYSVPGRSEVCGNHTDHQNGEVLAAAINLDMIAVIGKSNTIHVLSDDYDINTIDVNDLSKKDNEAGTSEGLIRGVLYQLQELNYHIGGFNALMTSDVLQGSGLSSSAAFEVMIGTIISGLYNDMNIDPLLIAQIGQYSENVYFEKPCGLMDQCACSIGSLIHIDFKDSSSPMVEKLDVDFPEFKHSLCIVDVHASHADLTSDYADIPLEMKQVAQFFNKNVLREVDEENFYQQIPAIRKATNDRAVLRAMHLFSENKRVEQAVNALNNQDFDTFKQTIKASGESSYKYLQNCFSPHDAKNQAVSLAIALSENILQDKGVCRVHGGGFAGTIQAFVEDDFVETYKAEIEKYFGEGSCHVLKVRKYGGKKVTQ
ncbi:MAG: galactokinase [Erysipelotrichaceae bacterium]|nr:galactokinase [Erysipelotrichaceae bacterium]